MAVKEFEYVFDPVKELKGGEQSAKVVWSTKSLDMAVDAIKKGLPLKANPFCGTNTLLLKPDLVYKRTAEEVEDVIRCMKDPIYFATKCSLMTPEGLQPVKMRDYQEEYLGHLRDNRFNIMLACRQAGKTQLIDSQIIIRFLNTENADDKLRKLNYYMDDNVYKIPMFELYNLYCKQTLLWKVKYHLYKLRNKYKNNIISKCISLLDYIDFKYIKKEYLTDNYKTIEEIELDESIQVLTDTGFSPVSRLMVSKPFDIYKITLENGYFLECADEHIVFNEDFKEIYVDQLNIGDYIQTDEGLKKIINIDHNNTKLCMGDITVNDDNHRFYSNGILSHNSVTTAVFGLWKILFFSDKNGSILSKSGPAGKDLLKKIKDMYLYLPYHLKCGTLKWNQTEIAFDNNSTLSTEAFSPTACLGKTINLLILDEFAWCPPNDVNLFYENVIPTVTTMPDSNVCICSTQNGFNKFYEIWNGAITGKSIYHPYKVDWRQVPNWDPETRKWVKRTKDWKDMMVGVLGSEESFQYQYGTAFLTSNNCLISREVLSSLHSNEILFENKSDLELCKIKHLHCLYINPEYDINNFKSKYYIVIVDLSEGKESDSTIFNILEIIYDKEKDKIKFKQVAYWKSNEYDLLESALEFWLLIQTLFKKDQSNVIVSIEWNTYGALFYNYLLQYNEKEYCKDNMWRFTFASEFDHTILCRYKKNNSDDDIISARLPKNNKLIPGVRWNGSNKKSSCALLKPMIESGDIIINDIVTISEIENFEDKNNNGHYKASYGHDDIIMTFVQLPIIIQSSKYKEFIEDIKSNKQEFNNSSWPGYGQNDFISFNDNFYETNTYLPIPGWN